jgi:thioredoxin 1
MSLRSNKIFKYFIKGDPCQLISPHYEILSKKYNTNKYFKVDIDELDDVASIAEITAIPSFLVYDDGVLIDELVGASIEKLEELIKRNCI